MYANTDLDRRRIFRAPNKYNITFGRVTSRFRGRERKQSNEKNQRDRFVGRTTAVESDGSEGAQLVQCISFDIQKLQQFKNGFRISGSAEKLK